MRFNVCGLTSLAELGQQCVRPHNQDLWTFSDSKVLPEAVDIVAIYLVDCFAQLPLHEQRLEAVSYLNGAGVKCSHILQVHRYHLAKTMFDMFQQLEPGGGGHGRLALGVANFGGASMCRQMVADMHYKQKAAEVLYYVIGKTDTDVWQTGDLRCVADLAIHD